MTSPLLSPLQHLSTPRISDAPNETPQLSPTGSSQGSIASIFTFSSASNSGSSHEGSPQPDIATPPDSPNPHQEMKFRKSESDELSNAFFYSVQDLDRIFRVHYSDELYQVMIYLIEGDQEGLVRFVKFLKLGQEERPKRAGLSLQERDEFVSTLTTLNVPPLVYATHPKEHLELALQLLQMTPERSHHPFVEKIRGDIILHFESLVSLALVTNNHALLIWLVNPTAEDRSWDQLIGMAEQCFAEVGVEDSDIIDILSKLFSLSHRYMPSSIVFDLLLTDPRHRRVLIEFDRTCVASWEQNPLPVERPPHALPGMTVINLGQDLGTNDGRSGPKTLLAAALLNADVAYLKVLIKHGFQANYQKDLAPHSPERILKGKTKLIQQCAGCYDDLDTLEFAYPLYGGSEYFFKGWSGHEGALLDVLHPTLCCHAIRILQFLIRNGFPFPTASENRDLLLTWCIDGNSPWRGQRRLTVANETMDLLLSFPQLSNRFLENCSAHRPPSFDHAVHHGCLPLSSMFQHDHQVRQGFRLDFEKYLDFIQNDWYKDMSPSPSLEFILSLPNSITHLEDKQLIKCKFQQGFGGPFSTFCEHACSVELPLLFSLCSHPTESFSLVKTLLKAQKRYPVSLNAVVNFDFEPGLRAQDQIPSQHITPLLLCVIFDCHKYQVRLPFPHPKPAWRVAELLIEHFINDLVDEIDSKIHLNQTFNVVVEKL